MAGKIEPPSSNSEAVGNRFWVNNTEVNSATVVQFVRGPVIAGLAAVVIGRGPRHPVDGLDHLQCVRGSTGHDGAQVAASRQRRNDASSTGSSVNRLIVRAVDVVSHRSRVSARMRSI